MKLLIPSIKNYFPDFNERIHTVDEAYQFCEKQGVVTVETDLIDDLGEYRFYKDTPFIFLHKFLTDNNRSWVFYHEITHFTSHPISMAKFSDEVQKRKIEAEANFAASIFLMPKYIIQTMKLEEIQEEFGYPRKIILIRKYLHDNYNKI